MLKKLQLKSGVNRENTVYASENGWYAGDKIRFRQGTPEKIGGWFRVADSAFTGVCRALFSWITLGGTSYVGVGTSTSYYVYANAVFTDITPTKATVTLGANPFTTNTVPATASLVTVAHTSHGANVGDAVIFSGATTFNGVTVVGEYRVYAVINGNSYTINSGTAATGTGSGGGTVVQAQYLLPVGRETSAPAGGWGVGYWGSGPWGVGLAQDTEARLWSQFNFGEDLIINPRYGGIYYWDASAGLSNNRAVDLASMPGASDVPVRTQTVTVSDVSRFVLAFGCNDYGASELDPLLIRWSDQEDATNWTPSATNQAGSLRLSHGSEIMTVMQARQEILVWTNTALYSLKYVGAPIVWEATLLGDNLSCPSPNGVSFAGSTMYWMGVDKFYKYDGSVQTLPCDLRSYVFSDLNTEQPYLAFSGTNEGFSEVWWFYPSLNSTTVDKYIVYNYLENVWYYGTMPRTAWLDSGLLRYPVAATGNNKLVYHEYGVDDYENANPAPIAAFIESAEFDLDDGDRFGFVWRVLPDVTFRGSTADSPGVTMTLYPRRNSGAPRNSPLSSGGNSSATVVRDVVVPVETYTGQVPIRVRGRQLAMRVESTGLGVNWQLGHPRLDIKPDGRR